MLMSGSSWVCFSPKSNCVFLGQGVFYWQLFQLKFLTLDIADQMTNMCFQIYIFQPEKIFSLAKSLAEVLYLFDCLYLFDWGFLMMSPIPVPHLAKAQTLSFILITDGKTFFCMRTSGIYKSLKSCPWNFYI